MKFISQVTGLAIAGVLFSSNSSATTGYFMHAYGVKAQGNAGVSIAQFQDALSIANNPAGLSWVGNRIDIGASIFHLIVLQTSLQINCRMRMAHMMAMDERILYCQKLL